MSSGATCVLGTQNPVPALLPFLKTHTHTHKPHSRDTRLETSAACPGIQSAGCDRVSVVPMFTLGWAQLTVHACPVLRPHGAASPTSSVDVAGHGREHGRRWSRLRAGWLSPCLSLCRHTGPPWTRALGQVPSSSVDRHQSDRSCNQRCQALTILPT